MFNQFWRPFVPGFRVRPNDDVPGFNVENGLPQRESAWPGGLLQNWVTQGDLGTALPNIPYGMGLPTSGLAAIAPTAPSLGLPGFHVEDNTPGFNVRPGNAVPGFNLNDDLDRQETILSAPTPSPDVEEPVQLPSPQFPEWVYKLVAMLPQALPASGPLVGRAVVVNSPPTLPPTEPAIAKRWPSLEMPHRSAENIGSVGGTTQSIGPQPVGQSTASKAWPQPVSWPYIQPARLPYPWSAGAISQPISLPPMFEPRAVEGSGFTLANAPSADAQWTQGQTPLQRHQQTHQSSSPGGVTQSSNDSSLGQRLVQSSVDTIPGAYYQRLAREQLGEGNYVGAGVYQGAALLDAALGAATLGLSTRLGAGIRAAAGGGAALFRRAFDSRSQLWTYLGRAPNGMQWHHIVEQSQVPQFGQRAIQSVENIVAIPIEAHRRLNAFYSSKLAFSEPNTVREWLRKKSFEEQYEFGMKQLKRVLGY